MGKLLVCLTFDLDFTDYAYGINGVDEFARALPEIFHILEKDAAKATWFIRLDRQIEVIYGRVDYFFQRYRKEIASLKQAGHEIAWHPHCYVRKGDQWQQNCDSASVAQELAYLAPVAQSYGLQAVRMGWGFHTNTTMTMLADLGFAVDSSAIPRPRYDWEKTVKDWTTTPEVPYFPGKNDYRVPGSPALPILEVPLSVIRVQAPYDTGPVQRYLNPAYHPDLWRQPLAHWLSQNDHLVTITHPYELLPRSERHDLLSFQTAAFRQNLTYLREIASSKRKLPHFITMSEFAASSISSQIQGILV